MHKRRLNDFKQERLRRMQAVDQVITTNTLSVAVFCRKQNFGLAIIWVIGV